VDEEPLQETPEQRYNREMRDKYRALFFSQVGRDVLSDILVTCHFFGTLDPGNPVQIAEYNVAVVIAAKAGILDDIQRFLGTQTLT
jgi:hypothetical protein